VYGPVPPTAVAVKVRVWPEIGNTGLIVKVPVKAPGGEIVIDCDIGTRVRAESVTLSETVKVPEALNVCEGFWLMLVFPSPKFQL
jgi:hypothetical protein